MFVAIGGFWSAVRFGDWTVDFTFPFSVEITRVDEIDDGLLPDRAGEVFFAAGS